MESEHPWYENAKLIEEGLAQSAAQIRRNESEHVGCSEKSEKEGN